MATPIQNCASWLLEHIVELDRDDPGLCGTLLRTASNHRMQVIGTVLALKECARAGETVTPRLEPALGLARGRLVDLLTQSLGSRPVGLLSLLRRMGPVIEKPGFYRKLLRVFLDPVQHELVRAIRTVRDLDARALDIMLGAPVWMLRAGLCAKFASTRERDDFISAIFMIRAVCPGVTDASMASSIKSLVSDGGSIADFVKSWLARSIFPEAPSIEDVEIVPILTASALHIVALDFQNCLVANYTLQILAGRAYFYRCTTPSGTFLAQLCRDDADRYWQLLRIHGKRNRTPPMAAQRSIGDRFRAAGIESPPTVVELPIKWQSIERLLDTFSADFDDLEDWLPESADSADSDAPPKCDRLIFT